VFWLIPRDVVKFIWPP